METAPFITAITALTGAIVYLWKTFHAKASKTENTLEGRWIECERKHAVTRDELTEVKVSVAQIDGRMQGYAKAKGDLQDMLMEAQGTTLAAEISDSADG